MTINQTSKFEVGQVVSIIGSLTLFYIDQIHTITCTAGTQITYDGFVGIQEPSWGKGVKAMTDKAFPKERVNINEINLEARKEII